MIKTIICGRCRRRRKPSEFRSAFCSYCWSQIDKELSVIEKANNLESAADLFAGIARANRKTMAPIKTVGGIRYIAKKTTQMERGMVETPPPPEEPTTD